MISPAPTNKATNEQDEIDRILARFKAYCRPEVIDANGVSSWADCLTQAEAKAALLAWRDHHTKEAVEAASFPFGPTYDFLYSNHKDVLEELEAHLTELAAAQRKDGNE